LEEWEREAPAFEQTLPMIQPPRPLYDIVVHEQDMRGAVGVPGGRDSEGAAIVFDAGARRFAAIVDETGLPSLEVETSKVILLVGTGAEGGRWAVDWFELFRSMSGRRSAAQIRALGCPEPYVELLPYLPMASQDVRELY
jgi:hypothetical protein